MKYGLARRGVIPGPLPALDEVLWEWIAVQERYARLSNWRDAFWWYNERAALSSIAGAVWRSGGVAMEEYSEVKKPKPGAGSSRGVDHRGRGDLFFKLGKKQYIVEAKSWWPRLHSSDPLGVVRLALRRAAVDVRRLYPERGQRLAIVVMAPNATRAYASQVTDLIDLWLKALRRFDGVSRAWTFPEETRALESESRRIYPGGALVVQPVG